MRKAGRTGITAQQMLLKLGLDKRDRDGLHAIIDNLVTKGKVEAGARGRYMALGGHAESGAKAEGGVEATIDIIMSGAGYARLGPGKDDVYVPENAVGTALHGDKVLLRISSGRGRAEGKVLQVLERRRTRYVGKVEMQGANFTLKADDQKMNRPFLITPEGLNGAKPGEKVIAEMAEWTNAREMPKCNVVRILGKAGEHEVEIHAILAEFDLPAEFPTEVEEAAENIPAKISDEEIAKRRDMRDIITLTIDPDDAKDLDDALSLRKLPNGNWEVGVHIADVSHYVRPGSIVDTEAAARATSVYLVDRVVPMLPERLSNNLCSLNPHEDKLSFSAIFELDEKAQVLSEWFGRSIMRSARRFAYADAQALIDGQEGEYKHEVLTHPLSQVLRKDRMANGALEVGGNEVKFKLDEKGRPVDVYEKVMGPANWLIEEFMLLANKRVAAWVSNRKPSAPPFVYRIHDLPDPEKIQQLRVLAKSFGHNEDRRKAGGTAQGAQPIDARHQRHRGGKHPEAGHHPLHEQGHLQYRKHRALRPCLSTITRTSPAPSAVTRTCGTPRHGALLSRWKTTRQEQAGTKLRPQQRHGKRAADAERASIKFKQAEYMSTRVGQTFAGIVSGLTSWGMYIEIIANKCEGMISLRDLPGDHYKFDQESYTVTGQRTGRRFRLGDEMEVMVRGVDMEKRVIDLALSDGGMPDIPPEANERGHWDETRPFPQAAVMANAMVSSPKGPRPKRGGQEEKPKGKKRR
ncbi:MAG: RNB domain-containing ribonuclease [Flavobacteriales bacterium]|nr:RNB domain-containing ribonuclease [Flavobacteriales bacterium]